jgi:hypothetical protein
MPKLKPCLFFRQWLVGKRKGDLIGIKIVLESFAGLSWRKLEMLILYEVEFALYVPSVLVSLVEGLNARFVLDSTEVNTSVAYSLDICITQLLLETGL